MRQPCESSDISQTKKFENSKNSNNYGVSSTGEASERMLIGEFRWQRRMMFVLIIILLLTVPALIWWMQSSSSPTAFTKAATVAKNQAAATDGSQNTTGQTDPADDAAYSSTGNSTSSTGSTSSNTSNNTASPTSSSSSTNPTATSSTTAGSTASSQPATVSCANGNCVSLQNGSAVTENGSIYVSSLIRAGGFQGDGSRLGNVNAVTLAGNPVSYFTNATNLNSGSVAPSLISSALQTLGVSTNIATASSPLTVAGGGTGANSLNAGQLLLGNGTAPIATLAGGSDGQCLLEVNGSPAFADCPSTTLQAAFNSNTTQVADIVTTGSHPTLSLQAGPGLDSSQPLTVANSSGTTTFAIGANGNLTAGSGQAVGQLTVNGQNASTPLAVLQAVGNQTADFLQARTSNGVTVAKIDAQGNAVFNTVSQTSGQANLANLNLSGNLSSIGSVSIGMATDIGAKLQVAAAPGQVGLIVRASTIAGDLLRLQTSNGSNLLRVDPTGSVYAISLNLSGNLDLAGHLTVSGAGVPTLGNLLNGLTQPLISGTDTAGSLSVVAGLGVNAGVLAHVNFNNTYGSTPHVLLTATSAAAASANIYVVASAGGFDIVSTTALPTIGLYSYNYFVIQ